LVKVGRHLRWKIKIPETPNRIAKEIGATNAPLTVSGFKRNVSSNFWKKPDDGFKGALFLGRLGLVAKMARSRCFEDEQGVG